MRTFDEINEVIAEVEAEPFEFDFHLGCIQCTRTGWASDHCQEGSDPKTLHTWYLQARLWRPDTDSGEMGWGAGGKNFISPHMTNSEITRICLKAALAFGEHEIREGFKYKGRRVYGPHLSVEALWDIAEDLEVR